MKSWLPIAALLLFTGIGQAENGETPARDRISLSAEATEEVDEDILVAILYNQQEGNDPARLAQKVNQAMQWAVQQTGQHPDITAKTRSYSTRPVYQKNRISAWRVRQALQLESRNISRLSQLIGDLQSRLSVESIQYRLSDPSRRAAEDRLIAQALESFGRRARLIAHTLGRKKYQLLEMSIITTDTPMPGPQVRMSTMSIQAKNSAPAIPAGKEKLRVRVQGSIQLSAD